MRTRLVGMATVAALVVGGLVAVVAQPAAGFGSSAPVPGPPSVNAGGYMTCGVQPDLTAACWGDNVSEGPGQSTPPAGVRFLEVNAGYNNGCGITLTRSVVCWGNNIGNKVTGVPTGTFLHVAPGVNQICALRTDGRPVCWGNADFGLVANTPTSETFTQLTIGARHACGLRTDGTVLCWGSNQFDQLNIPPGEVFTSINSGNFDTCGIRPDASVVCWGRNSANQANEPAGPFVQVSAGFQHVCGLRPDRSITCWGSNAFGQAAAPVGGQYTNVSTGTFHSCAMPVSGPPALCWGNNAAGRVQPSLNSSGPPNGAVGTPVNHRFTMATTLSPAPTFRLVGGALPPGLSLSPQGLLTGTPTRAGTFTFTVAAANALSPPDCPLGAGGDFFCSPGNPGSTATATRTYLVVIGPAGGSTSTTAPPTTTTTRPPGTPANQCATLVQQRQEFNAQATALADRLRAGGAFLVPLVASVEQARTEGNANFDRQLAGAGCALSSI